MATDVQVDAKLGMAAPMMGQHLISVAHVAPLAEPPPSPPPLPLPPPHAEAHCEALQVKTGPSQVLQLLVSH
jgi:hypothetical protein